MTHLDVVPVQIDGSRRVSQCSTVQLALEVGEAAVSVQQCIARVQLDCLRVELHSLLELLI